MASDAQAIFQIQVPSEPVVEVDGSIRAGGLQVVPLSPLDVNVVSGRAAVSPAAAESGDT